MGMEGSIARIETEMLCFTGEMKKLSNYVKVNKKIIFFFKNNLYIYIYIYIYIFFFPLQTKTLNIYDFFPIQDEATLDKFLKQDENYEERKNQFSTVVLNAIPNKLDKFTTAVIKAVFGAEYIATHRWPTIK